MRGTVMTAVGGAVLLAAGAAPGAALAAKPTHKPKVVHHQKKAFAMTEIGNRLSTTGVDFEDVYRVTKGPFGEGSVIRDAAVTGTTFPATGSDTAKTYDRGGRTFAHETFTLGTPNTDGVGSYTGNGTCRSGTGSHLGETCTYTIKGSYDLITGITNLTLSGTYTLGSKAKPVH